MRTPHYSGHFNLALIRERFHCMYTSSDNDVIYLVELSLSVIVSGCHYKMRYGYIELVCPSSVFRPYISCRWGHVHIPYYIHVHVNVCTCRCNMHTNACAHMYIHVLVYLCICIPIRLPSGVCGLKLVISSPSLSLA